MRKNVLKLFKAATVKKHQCVCTYSIKNPAYLLKQTHQCMTHKWMFSSRIESYSRSNNCSGFSTTNSNLHSEMHNSITSKIDYLLKLIEEKGAKQYVHQPLFFHTSNLH